MKHSESAGSSRRKFVQQMACAGIGSTTLYSLLLNLATTTRASAQTLQTGSGYKALVCLFLEGGNDSFNLLTPMEPEEFARYKLTRADLALEQQSLLELTHREGGGRRFGVHPSMPEVRDLYNQGKLSFVCNVGTLVEPTNLAAINNYTARLPLGLYSHADQVMHWQTSTPDTRGSIGWAGRAAEVLHSLNETDAISMNISLSGTNVFQSGKKLIPYSITPDGAALLHGYRDATKPFFQKAVDSMLEQHYQNLLKQTYANITRDSIASGEVFLKAWKNSPQITTSFPDSGLGRNLRGVAQGIAARGNLGMKRQTYFIRYGGWDHHDEVLASQSNMLSVVSKAVASFWKAMGELGLQDDVLLFTASDFGRTLSSNGKGSDHGWGGNQFVLGGGHKGGKLYGNYPVDLAMGNQLDTGRGRLIPTTSVDEYACELALWLGVGKADIPYTLPNVERFYSLNSDKSPLGMFG